MPIVLFISGALLVLYALSKKKFITKLQLHLFFPSWRFFEKTGPISQFYYRSSTEDSNFGDWETYDNQKLKLRTIKDLFYNPEENYYLATRSVIDKMIMDIEEINLPLDSLQNEIRGLVSYQLVVNLANTLVVKNLNSSLTDGLVVCRPKLISNDVVRPELYFQFKVAVAWLDKTPIIFEDVFISDVHKAML